MKSEHRHELAQNDLEMLISKLRARYAYIVETHGNRILLWASVAFLAVAAAVYWAKSSNSTNADGWSALAGARSPEDLAGIAEAYAGTPVGNWARLNVAEQYLQSGLRLMFSDRAAAKTDLDEAKNAFEELLNANKISPAIRERALYGMARTLETTSGGDLKPAVDAYNKLLADFPETPYKPAVEQQLERLDKKSTQEFYAWFAAQNPEPADRETPEDLMNSMNQQLNVPGMPTLPGAGTESPAVEDGVDENGEPMAPGAEQTPLSVPSAPAIPPTDGNKPAAEGEAPKAGEMPADAAATPETSEEPAAKPEAADKPAEEPKTDSAKSDGAKSDSAEKTEPAETAKPESASTESAPTEQPESGEGKSEPESKPEPASTESSEPAANDAN